MADDKSAALPEGTDKVIKGASGDTATIDAPAVRQSDGKITDKIRRGTENLSSQAGEKARGLVSQGLERSAEALGNVDLVHDDVFASELSPASFDLVHARFQLAPLGRVEEQLAAFQRLTKSGGWLVLEDPDIASWRVHPDAPALSRLVVLIEQGFVAAGGDFNAGRKLPDYLRSLGGEPRVAAHVVALADGHPYLRLPLQFATSLRPRLESLVGAHELERLMRDAEVELTRPETWGTTFTLIQAFSRLPG